MRFSRSNPIALPRSSFASSVRRARLPWPSAEPLRILSIDGGGIKGVFAASVLAELEARHLGGESISRYFDLITGTSTGGILALGLAIGTPARSLLNLYLHDGAKIFPPGRLRRFWLAARRVALYGYDRAALSEALTKTVGDRILADSGARLCIPAFEGHHGEVYIFKTPHHPDYRIDGLKKMTTVAEATSAAPSYFRSLDSGGYRFVDGGVWANNPVMIGVVDAMACFDIQTSQIRVLSLGCGRDVFRVDRARSIGGLYSWREIIFAAMELQSQNALGQTRLLIGPDNLIRLEPLAQERPIQLDDWERATTELPPMASDLVEKRGRDIAALFLSLPTQPPRFFWPPEESLGSTTNQPIHGLH